MQSAFGREQKKAENDDAHFCRADGSDYSFERNQPPVDKGC